MPLVISSSGLYVTSWALKGRAPSVLFHSMGNGLICSIADLSNDANLCALKITDSQHLGSYCEFFFSTASEKVGSECCSVA